MELTNKKCIPCEGMTEPLTIDEEGNLLNQLPDWVINRESVHRIKRDFEFATFTTAIKFVNKIAEIAEAEGHHPHISILYNLVIIDIYTHSINGLSENDFILASKIDEMFNNNF